MNIKTPKDLADALKQGPYTSVGGYPVFFYTRDGETLSYKTVKKNFKEIVRGMKNNDFESTLGRWDVIGVDVNWEDPEMYDDESGERIKSAYAEERAENPGMPRWSNYLGVR